ncbi:MAG: hypothetical protein BWK78_03825 [Thiotrichaceae bacterium IS1]|nr:MAG: hypothetical protein BWK78_03825 [Thiotrichaceae bacterium IS1]
MSIEKGIQQSYETKHASEAKKWFEKLVQSKQYVGELYSINYENARVQIHDHEKQQVGGIPSLSFLIATRIDPNVEDIDFKNEDSSIILLRVMDAAQLPNSAEAERIRVETAQKVSGSTDHWDKEAMDAKTRVYLGYAGVECRIIGTFYLDQKDENNIESPLILKFGCDLSNYYPNRGLKVYKPNAEALKEIVNYTDLTNQQDLQSIQRVELGLVRYASTNRKYQQIDNVPVSIFPADLLTQKTAVFGMTRTGKSNTVKIIAKSVYQLRYQQDQLRIGQIIFDPNGEYANENEQDNNNALKNVWQIRSKVERKGEVVTYGLEPHPYDPERKLMKINFYDDKMLPIGKEIINARLSDETSQYFRNFCQVIFQVPEKEQLKDDGEFFSELTRYTRRKLVYQTLLKKAGFQPPKASASLKLGKNSLFNQDLRKAMSSYEDKKDKKKEGLIKSAAIVFENEEISWDNLIPAFEGLFYFLATDAYNNFNNEYLKKHKGESWADADLERLLEMFAYTKGTNLIGELKVQHTHTLNEDYAEAIYKDLVDGKLVIVDQSSGNYEVNKFTAQRIMEKIFNRNQSLFREGEPKIPEILVYIEEAHSLLPSDKEKDLRDIWVRTAKEGAKYHIGMVYSTQEVSSIQKNILKNTANWFIGHLNNTDETKELCKYYDFADFESSIRRAQDKGFLRVKTLSNYFVIPVQVKKFDVTD